MSKRKPGDSLNHPFVNAIKKPGTYGDGHGSKGLRLIVRARARAKEGVRKTWSQRILVRGKTRDLGLGSFPDVLLAEARDKAQANWQRDRQGEDILVPPPTVPTVAQGFEAIIIQRKGGWDGKSTEYSWRQSLRHCKPIRSTPVSDVTEDDVMKILTPLWHKKGGIARNVRIHLSAVMHRAIKRKNRTLANPVPTTKELNLELKRQRPSVHHTSLNHRQLGAALATIRDSATWWAAKYCLIFVALTCVRSGEAREATWNEIDWDTRIWTIPGSRTKNGEPHQVPLSAEAIWILKHAQERTGRSEGLIFPAERGGGSKPMDSGRLANIPKRLGLGFRPHGLRASYANWAGPSPDIAVTVAGAVLGQKQPTVFEQHYMTDDLVEYRTPIMQRWATYLRETMGPVISTLPDVKREKRESFRVQKYDRTPITETEYQIISQSILQSRQQGEPDQDTLRGAVVIAAIGLMRDSLISFQKTVGAHWSDLQRHEDGTSRLTTPFSKRNRSGRKKSKREKTGRGDVTYVSARVMAALEEMRRLRHKLGLHIADDERIFQMSITKMCLCIKEACAAAGLEGNYSGYSPRNGMEQDLIRKGFGVDDIRRARCWKIPSETTDAERKDLATHGTVAQWYALTEPSPVVKTTLTADEVRFPSNGSPLMQNWSNFLTAATPPVTPTTEE